MEGMSWKRNVLLRISYILTCFPLLEGAVPTQYLTSPCPNTFQYEYDEGGILFGKIQTDCPDANVIELALEMSVGNAVKDYNGHIELAYPQDKLINDILYRRPIYYKLHFPLWTSIPPRITKITLNGVLLCEGPKIPIRAVQLLTTINLKHRLTISSHLKTAPTQRKQLPSPSVRNPSNFKPEIPNDISLSNVYKNNPFFQNIPIQNRPTQVNNGGHNGFGNNFIQNVPTRGNRGNQNHFGSNFIQNMPSWENRGNQNGFGGNFIENVPAWGHHGSQNGFGTDFIQQNVPPRVNHDKENGSGGNPFFQNSPNTNIHHNPGYHNPSTNSSHVPELVAFDSNNLGTSVEIIHSKGTDINPGSIPAEPTPSATPQRPPRTSNRSITTVLKPSSEEQPYWDVCGLPINNNPLIVHGEGVRLGAYPWLAALFGVTPRRVEYRCGGSLVTNKHVITAAHCLMDGRRVLRNGELLIVLGRSDIQQWSSSADGVVAGVSSIVVHDDRDASTADADIGVVTLKERLQWTKFIRPVCLWSGEEDLRHVVGSVGTVVGWGMDQEEHRSTARPNQVSLPIVSNEDCLWADRTFGSFTSSRTFCAGRRDGKGPCNGDSGSGFIIRKGGRWMLRGVVSMSKGGPIENTCDLSNYIVFVDVAKFRTWILSNIR